mmetsp:Transcript_33309/g.59620  ORF Transcript_33309/g.59620 Transcript_33309/m.59620 type:complete len:208 (-) Transcript_33309:36-659(-)
MRVSSISTAVGTPDTTEYPVRNSVRCVEVKVTSVMFPRTDEFTTLRPFVARILKTGSTYAAAKLCPSRGTAIWCMDRVAGVGRSVSSMVCPRAGSRPCRLAPPMTVGSPTVSALNTTAQAGSTGNRGDPFKVALFAQSAGRERAMADVCRVKGTFLAATVKQFATFVELTQCTSPATPPPAVRVRGETPSRRRSSERRMGWSRGSPT